MVKAYVIKGFGIGCHQEVAHAYETAGAKAEIIHFTQLLSGEKDLFRSQIINLTGGFLHGDILGAGVCAANELEHAVISGKRLKDMLLEYVERGNIIYAQCNGFQLLVKTGLLPGAGGDHSSPRLTLTHNDCGNYWVAPVLHTRERVHFAFQSIEDDELLLWCRHGEGKIQFYSRFGLISRSQARTNRKIINKQHVLLRYADPFTLRPTEKFPHNPNGSEDGIAGLVDETGRIFGHMAHPEVSILASRDPRWFVRKDLLRRKKSIQDKSETVGLKIFRNIVQYLS
jgi:phosphoribosylformylglycinamidine synthase